MVGAEKVRLLPIYPPIVFVRSMLEGQKWIVGVCASGVPGDPFVWAFPA